MNRMKSNTIFLMGLFGIIPVVQGAEAPLGDLIVPPGAIVEPEDFLTIIDYSSTVAPQNHNTCGLKVAQAGAVLLPYVKGHYRRPDLLKAKLAYTPPDFPTDNAGMFPEALRTTIRKHYGGRFASDTTVFDSPINQIASSWSSPIAFPNEQAKAQFAEWLARFRVTPRGNKHCISPRLFILQVPQKNGDLHMGHYVGCIVARDDKHRPIFYYVDPYDGIRDQEVDNLSLLSKDSDPLSAEEIQALTLNTQVESQRIKENKHKNKHQTVTLLHQILTDPEAYPTLPIVRDLSLLPADHLGRSDVQKTFRSFKMILAGCQSHPIHHCEEYKESEDFQCLSEGSEKLFDYRPTPNELAEIYEVIKDCATPQTAQQALDEYRYKSIIRIIDAVNLKPLISAKDYSELLQKLGMTAYQSLTSDKGLLDRCTNIAQSIKQSDDPTLAKAQQIAEIEFSDIQTCQCPAYGCDQQNGHAPPEDTRNLLTKLWDLFFGKSPFSPHASIDGRIKKIHQTKKQKEERKKNFSLCAKFAQITAIAAYLFAYLRR